MNPPKTRIDPKSEIFQQQRGAMLALIARLQALEGRALAASAASKPAFDKRGALLPRERLARLLDPGAPFLELASLAGYCTDDADPESSIPGAAVIAGIGVVSGMRCMVVANDSGIGAGALSALAFVFSACRHQDERRNETRPTFDPDTGETRLPSGHQTHPHVDGAGVPLSPSYTCPQRAGWS